ncbi:MAG: hypothetical protein ACUZ8O_14320 [Candidatus Anammoxibacter sp.]
MVKSSSCGKLETVLLNQRSMIFIDLNYEKALLQVTVRNISRMDVKSALVMSICDYILRTNDLHNKADEDGWITVDCPVVSLADSCGMTCGQLVANIGSLAGLRNIKFYVMF